MISRLAAFVACVVFAATVNADCARNYTIQPGDSCNAISVAQNVSTYQLAIVNTQIIDNDCDNLFAGEVICLGNVGEDCTTVHLVATGDFCSAIAGAAGIPLQTLLANNPQVYASCANIYPGEVLCVANTTFNYTS